MNKNIKVGIYCRVGNKDQLAIKNQKEKLKEYCKVNDYEIYKIYEDNGYSATDSNRPGYNAMLTDLKESKFNTIMVFSIDRLTRSAIEMEQILKLLEDYNCSLNFFKDQIDTKSPMSKMDVRTMTIFSDLIKEFKNE